MTAVAEVVGPPGSGKSTVHHALAGRGIRSIGNYLAVRRLPAWAVSAVEVAQVLREARAAGFGRRQLTWIVRLQATPRVLSHESRGASAVVFDQGPVFALVRLRQALEQARPMPRALAWWDERIRWWAARLDLIVELDARDDVLLARVRTREKDHALRRIGDAEAVAALAAERASYRSVVDQLVAAGRCRLERVDTGVDDVVSAVERARRAFTAEAI